MKDRRNRLEQVLEAKQAWICFINSYRGKDKDLKQYDRWFVYNELKEKFLADMAE